jgi:2-amino-4-hydroxy-6-hydroxymethyldihydropteridine diphosphokinase
VRAAGKPSGAGPRPAADTPVRPVRTGTLYLGLGSNVGDRLDNLCAALDRLVEGGVAIRRVSSLYETEPVGYREQGWFLNAVAEAETELGPEGVLALIQRVEAELGRKRTIPNGPRTVDLDILLWGDLAIDEDELQIPHPRLNERLFVLAPLCELNPALRHPRLGVDMAQLQAALAGGSEVRIWRKDWWPAA